MHLSLKCNEFGKRTASSSKIKVSQRTPFICSPLSAGAHSLHYWLLAFAWMKHHSENLPGSFPSIEKQKSNRRSWLSLVSVVLTRMFFCHEHHWATCQCINLLSIDFLVLRVLGTTVPSATIFLLSEAKSRRVYRKRVWQQSTTFRRVIGV